MIFQRKLLTYILYNVPYSTRVRFAPSPTGQLHIGGLKTALINYLFSKSYNGKLIFRLEDTDRSRYNHMSVESIINSLNWLGITFDEGIHNGSIHDDYKQSNRLSYYQAAVEKLLAEGKAYHCFCSSQRLDFLRKEQNRRGENPGYDRKCLKLTTKEIVEKLQQGSPCVIRLKVPEDTEIEFDDAVFGHIKHRYLSVDIDPVLMKADRYPVYHLANVVDDHLMGITHVIRGQEWLVSTPKHVLLYRAFGYQQPQFAHLPLIMKEDGRKVSKRSTDFLKSYHNIDHLMEDGHSRESVLSWLMSSGGGLSCKWHPSISMAELVNQFSLSQILTHNASLSESTLHICGRSHYNSLILDCRYFDEVVVPYFLKNGISMSFDKFERYFHRLKHRMTCLKDFTQFSYLWSYSVGTIDDLTPLMKDKTATLTEKEAIRQLFERFLVAIHEEGDCSENIEKIHDGICSKSSAMNCLRKSLINKLDGPRISELVNMLTKEEIYQRLNLTLV